MVDTKATTLALSLNLFWEINWVILSHFMVRPSRQQSWRIIVRDSLILHSSFRALYDHILGQRQRAGCNEEHADPISTGLRGMRLGLSSGQKRTQQAKLHASTLSEMSLNCLRA